MKNQSSPFINAVHPDLIIAQSLVYLPNRFECSTPLLDKESSEYGACSFKINSFHIYFRVAKITPTKVGQFVTLWKRKGNGPIQPYEVSDPVDFFVISTRKGNHFGQFVFPKSVLRAQNIVSENGKGGKRGIRVYPPWDKTTSPQAGKTQEWQIKYFLEIPAEGSVDLARCQELYS